MTAFEGNKQHQLDVSVRKSFRFFVIEFGVLPEIAKAVEEMEWT